MGDGGGQLYTGGTWQLYIEVRTPRTETLTNPATVAIEWIKPDGTELPPEPMAVVSPGTYMGDVDLDEPGRWRAVIRTESPKGVMRRSRRVRDPK